MWSFTQLCVALAVIAVVLFFVRSYLQPQILALLIALIVGGVAYWVLKFFKIIPLALIIALPCLFTGCKTFGPPTGFFVGYEGVNVGIQFAGGGKNPIPSK